MSDTGARGPGRATGDRPSSSPRDPRCARGTVVATARISAPRPPAAIVAMVLIYGV